MVGFEVKDDWYEIGHGDFLYAFFSTVAYHLEGNDWGSRFPMIMNELYQGKLRNEALDEAILELSDIKNELAAFPPDQIIWDIEDLTKQPPWGDNISSEITSLANYFVTSDGVDFLDMFSHALQKAKKLHTDLNIV